LFRKLPRLLVPAVVVGAVALAPGVASAGDDPPNPTDLVDQVQDAVTGGTVPAGGSDPATASGQSAEESPLPEPPEGLDPSALQPLFDALGLSPECTAAMQEDFQGVIDSIPATVQAIIDAIVDQLPTDGLSSPTEITDPESGATVLLAPAQGGEPPSFTAEDPPALPVVDALQKMFDDFQELCVPAPPAPGGNPPPPPGGHVSPGVAPPAPPPAAAPPAPQPVSYPGYAPTGGTPEESASPLPLAALGGLVLLSGAVAAGYRMSSSGARSRG
jgi:hypothetical protein